jgi:hypothetical protein
MVTGMTIDPASVRIGSSFSVKISGTNINEKTYFDLRFRAPNSNTDQIALNWQQGTSASHMVSPSTTPGTWVITGIRSHQVIDDINGAFVPVSVVLDVIPR